MKIAVIGGGPAGMMSAISAKTNGANVWLFDKNEKLGKKMYISGKGRCNLTNDCSVREFVSNVATNPKFTMGAVSKFTPQDVIDFCQSRGLQLKTERGNRVFPCSDKSSDVIKVFAKELERLHVVIKLNEKVTSLCKRDGVFRLETALGSYEFDKVIVATGGISYSATGSTGDGYKFASNLGHTVVDCKPALCRILCNGVQSLEGVSLKNVTVGISDVNGKTLDSEFGEMLFADNAVSGPAVLTLSSRINKLPKGSYKLFVDLKPALDSDKLDARILRDFSERMNKDFVNSLDGLLPERLFKVVALQSGIPFEKKVNQISVSERQKLVATLKNLTFDYVGLDNVEYGIVTSGGVDVKQINPSTMESKLVDGLFFAGEVIDVDAYTGGFNIQFALSCGYVAGTSASK